MPGTLRLFGFGALALAIGVVVGVAVFLAATYAHLYSATHDGRRILRALPREFLAEIWAVVSWPWFALLGRRYEGRGRGPRPVILLHGYGMNRMSFWWLGRALARRGLGPLHAMTYVSLSSVRSSARRLARFVEHVCEGERVKEVDIVCHSLGGIVARYYAARLGGASRVRHIVTIGSPHHGTMTGRVSIGRSAFELRPDSSLLSDLAMGPCPVRIASIYSLADNVIVPPRNASLAGVGEDVVFDDLGHMALLLSPRVADEVAARLGESTSPAGLDPQPVLATQS